MAGIGRNDDLPPDYVTLVQLRDIWMKKQEEKKRKEKEEEERKLAEELRRKQEEEKRNGGLWRGRVRRAGLIDEKGKGKEVIVCGYGNVEGDKKRSNDRGFRRPKSRGGERNRNEGEREREREKFRVEERVNNGKELVSMNGVRGGIPDGKRVEFRGGFRKNGRNRCRNEGGDGLNQLKQNEGGSDLGGGVLDDKGYNQKRGEGGRNNNGYENMNYRLKEESRDAVLKGKGVEPETVKKGEDEIVEVLGEGSGLRGRGRNGYKRRSGKYRGRYNKFRESRDAVLRGKGLELETEKKGEDGLLEIFNEKCSLSERGRSGEEKRKVTNEVKVDGEGLRDDRDKVGNGVIAAESVKNGENEGVGEGFRRNGNGRGDSGKSRSGNRYNRYGNWKGRFVEGRDYRFKESGYAVLIGNKLELETEKKVEEKILEVFNEKDTNNGEKRNGTNEDRAKGEGLSDDRVVGDGFLMVERMKNGEKEGVGKGRGRSGKGKGKAKDRNDKEKRNRNNEDIVEGEGSSDDRVAVGSKVDDGILMVESVKNGKKEGVGKEHSRFGKRKGKGEILEVLNEKDKNNGNEGNRTNEDRAEGEGAVVSMVDDGVLAMESVKNGEKEGVGEESRFENRKGKADDKIIKIFHLKFRISGDSDDDERNITNEDRAKAEGSSDDGMALESKVDDDGVLMVEKVKNAEKEGVGKEGYGRHRNKEEKFGGRRSGNGYNGFGNRKGSFGEGRLGNGLNRRISNRGGNVSGMVWVKKEEKSGPVAAGASGVQHVKSN